MQPLRERFNIFIEASHFLAESFLTLLLNLNEYQMKITDIGAQADSAKLEKHCHNIVKL